MNSLVKNILNRRLSTFTSVQRQLGFTDHASQSFQCGRLITSTASTSHFDSTANHLTVEIMRSYGVKSEKILRQVTSMPMLANSNPDTWKNLMDTMLRNGYKATTTVDMVLRHPKLLKMSPKYMRESWHCWLECFHQHDIVRELIKEHPIFLSIRKSNVTARYELLKAVVGSQKFVAIILMKCPQIMFQSQTDLEKVCDYISSKMIVRNVAEYYRSVALGCTLEEVKTRHMFLERCGKYKTPNLKQSDKIPTGNPSLSEIFNTSEEEFATKVAGVTLEEFVVFQAMYGAELMKNADDSGSDSEDSDS